MFTPTAEIDFNYEHRFRNSKVVNAQKCKFGFGTVMLQSSLISLRKIP